MNLSEIDLNNIDVNDVVYGTNAAVSPNGFGGEDGGVEVALNYRSFPLMQVLTSTWGNGGLDYADIDTDGDLDIFLTTGNNKDIEWWKNDGAGNFTLGESIDQAVPAASPHAVSLDGDPYPDVIASSYSDNDVLWWKNDGAGNFGLKQTIDPNFLAARGVYPANLDGDGDMDVLGASYGGNEIVWWRNNGLGGFASKQIIGSNFTGASFVYSANLDDDEYPDVLGLAMTAEDINWWKNDGAGNFVLGEVIDNSFTSPQQVSAIDLDGDDDLDVLGTNWNGSYYWENDGFGNFGPRIQFYGRLGANSVYSVDLDKDGNGDVLSTYGYSKLVVWHKNDGSGNFTHQIIDNNFYGANATIAADFDGDGDNDIVIAAGNTENKIVYREHIPVYFSSGIYKSVLDAGPALYYNYGDFEWTQTTDDDSDIEMRVRSSNSSTTPPNFDDNPCVGPTSPISLTTTCAEVHDRYLWYEASFTNPITDDTSSLDSVTTDVGTLSSYEPVGTFTSNIQDTGADHNFQTIDWTETSDLTKTDVRIKVRTCDDILCDGEDTAKAWNTCAAFERIDRASASSTNMSSSSSCVTNGDQYVQYQTVLSTTDIDITPRLNDVTFGLTSYPVKTGDLTSAWFNTTDLANILAIISWSENEQMPLGTNLKLQMRTADNNDNGTGETITDDYPNTYSTWQGSTGDDTYFYNEEASCDPKIGTSTTCSLGLGLNIADSVNDQWFQYRAIIESDNGASPILTSVNITYVVNATPEFDSGFGATAIQNSDGTVSIEYKPRDPDATDGSVTPGFVTPSFQYSLNGGSTWTSIVSDLSASATSSKAVDMVSYGDPNNSFAPYSLIWTPKNTLNGTYVTNAQIRVTIDDNEAANNTASLDSIDFILDLKNPIGDNISTSYEAIKVNGRQESGMAANEVEVTLKVADDSSTYYRYSLSSTTVDGLIQTDTINTDPATGSGVWILDNSLKTAGVVVNLFLDDAEMANVKEDYVFVQYKDNFENLNSFVYQVETPERPTSMMIQDITNTYTEIPEVGLFITWKTTDLVPGVNQGDFAKYVIERATSETGPFTQLGPDIIDRTVNYYRDSDIIFDGDSYYRVYTVDVINNTSFYSPVLYGIPNGTQDAGEGGGGQAATPPVISNVTSNNIYTSQATITWTTNELSDSLVEFLATTTAPTASQVFTDESAPSIGVASMLTTHQVVLSGLTPNTNYYYQVKSTNAAVNTATEYSSYSFTTLAGPVIASSSVVVSGIGNNHAQIIWQTDVNADTYLVYSNTITFNSSTEVGQGDSVTDHSVTITDLAMGTRYYYYVKSGIAQDDNYGNMHYFLTTSDINPPVISNVSSTAKRASAIINWETEEDADSIVNYGTTTALGSTESSSVFTKEHSIDLNSLIASTSYYYQIVSKDSGGNTATSTNYTFNTEGIDISNVSATVLSETSMQITWDTNEAASSQIEYALASNLTASTLEPASPSNSTNNHSLGLSSLSQKTVYYYRVISHLDGRNFYSPIYHFTTGDTDEPIISNINVIDISSNKAVISWDTDEETDSLVEYGSVSGVYASSTNDATLTRKHSVEVTDLDTFVDYYFRLTSTDGSSNATTTVEQSFATTLFTITDVLAATVATSTVDISWETSETASSQVQYSTASNFSSSSLEPLTASNQTTAHSILVSDLEQGTIYYYRVRSVRDDKTVISPTYTFTTGDATAPVITNIVVSSIIGSGAIVTWDTDESTDSYLEYGLTSGDLNIATSSAVLSRAHYFQISGLETSTIYYYRVRSTDANSNTSISNINDFTSSDQPISQEELDTLADEVVSLEAQVEAQANEQANSGSGTLIIDKTDKIAPIISSVAVIDLGDETAKITWSTNELANSMVSYGQSSDYDLLGGAKTLVSKTKNHAVTLQDLRPLTAYNFSAVSADASGNITFSDNYQFKTLSLGERSESPVDLAQREEEQASSLSQIQILIQELLKDGKVSEVDIKDAISKTTEPPMISGEGPTISKLTSNDMTVNWKTNRKSNSIVVYYQEKLGPDFAEQAGNFSQFTTDHTVSLSGLKSGTTYVYMVQSVDALGSVGSSVSDKFKTESVPYISKVTMANITNSSMEIFWESNIETSSELDYGVTKNYGKHLVAGDGLGVMHSTKLTELESGTEYHFRVKGATKTGELIVSDDYTFSTLESADVLSYNLLEIGDKQAKVKWQTNNRASSEIVYVNMTNDESKTIAESKIEKNHSIDLIDLIPGTKYSFVIKGTDEFGQGVESSAFEFTTLIDTEAPIIEYVQTDMALISKGENSRVQSVITWATDEISSTELIFTEGAARDLQLEVSSSSNMTIIEGEKALTTKHILVVTDFKPATVYTFKAKSIDESGNVSHSKDYTVLTPSKKESVLQVIMGTFEETFGWLKLGG